MIKKLTVSAVFTAISVVCMIVASLWTVKISMLVISSVLISVVITECGTRYAWLTFAATVILSAFILPRKTLIYAYAFFLGYYPIIKLYIEKINKLHLEWLLKIISFNIILVGAYFIFKLFFVPTFNPEILSFVFKHLSLIIIALEVAFIFYDVLMSYIITFYNGRIRFLIQKFH